MATTSHGLSVYINSCVKNPLHSKSRGVTTFSDRNTKTCRFVVTDPGPVCDASDEFMEDALNGLETSQSVRASFEEVEAELKSLTDEQFYFKLQQLKESNRKTLEECEKLYQQKYGGDGQIGETAAKEMVENMFAARLAARSGLVEESRAPMRQNGDMTNGYLHDRGITLSSKPPPVPFGKRETSLSKTSPSQYSASQFKPQHSSAPVRSSQYIRRSYSLDENDWRKAMRASSDISDDEVQSEGPLDAEAEAAVTRIGDMWRGFKIDDYSPSDRRHSASSMASRRKKEKVDIGDNWRHRITIPKPFQMSMRESAKTKTKTKAQQELEQQRLEEQRAEEEECQKKFKAQPAPANIYLPLYDEIQEKTEARRRFVKQYSKELLQSKEKPFNFTKREEDKRQHRVRSATVAERIAQSVQKTKNKKQEFVARPVPEFVYSNAPREKLLEEEEYRKIRIKMRARELLRESALPPNMAINQKLKEQKEKEKLQKTKKNTHSKRRPKSAHQVPDYDHMYLEFQKELARRRQAKEATVMEPFPLQTNNLRSSRERLLRDMERDEKIMKDTALGTPRLSLGVLSSSLDSIPFKSSNSADLRTGYFRSMKDREMRQQELEEEDDRRKRMRETKLRKYITERSGDTPRGHDGLKNRLKQHKVADVARMEDYQKNFDEMRTRVENRPLLFEQETKTNAGKAAEKKFQTTLKTAGIDEEFIRTRSSAVPSAQSDGDYEDDYDYEEEN